MDLKLKSYHWVTICQLNYESFSDHTRQAIWFYAMVRFRTIDLKSHSIAQFEENRIIRKKKLNQIQVK